MQDKKQNNIIEQDLELIKGILQKVPQEKIPERFESDFRKAFKAEAMKIEGEEIKEARKKKFRKWVSAAAGIAACFIVGIVSLSMYNNGIGSINNFDTASEESDIVMDGGQTSAGKADLPAMKDSEQIGIASNDELSDLTEERATQSAEPETYGIQKFDMGDSAGLDYTISPIDKEQSNQSIATIEDDSSNEETMSRQRIPRSIPDSKTLTLTEEFIYYTNLVNEYMGDMDFELISYSREISTGNHLFNILIVNDENGNPINERVMLIGTEGEIYEQPIEEQQNNSD